MSRLFSLMLVALFAFSQATKEYSEPVATKKSSGFLQIRRHKADEGIADSGETGDCNGGCLMQCQDKNDAIPSGMTPCKYSARSADDMNCFQVCSMSGTGP